ncbi:hypothetical protein QBC43DRAFT_361456 [Cladorrhinum sp. PSN259]|nr:hypothetical protein QBC43DRAFT_361456 [Cladorrhinum sp. PSN259]
MRLSTAVISLLGAHHTLVLAQRNTNPPCIDECMTKNPVSSWCDGDETGAALDECRCSTFLGATSMFTCIKSCSTADQAVLAGNLPELCRNRLLPGITPSTTQTSTGSAATTPSTTSGSSSGGATSTTSSGTAAQTSSPGVARKDTGSGMLAIWALLSAVLFI